MKKNKLKNLTIAIITHRSNQVFINCLKSSQISDKVLVIDNNSNNNWKQLKQKYHFKVIKHTQLITNFTKVRNEILNKITTNWTLFLDSDEVLSNKQTDIKVIKSIINSNNCTAASLQRADVFLNRELKYGEAKQSIVRLVKTKQTKFVNNVHEVAKTSGAIIITKIKIKHYSHPNITEFLNQVSIYSQLASKNENNGKVVTVIKMVTYPIMKFIINYLLKRGFLDGYRGLVYALLMSLHSFFVRVFYYEKKFNTKA